MQRLSRMQELDDLESKPPHPLGFVGVAFTVLGICPLAEPLRLSCLAAACICSPICFHSQTEWPASLRWVLSLLADFFFAYVGWSVLQAP